MAFSTIYEKLTADPNDLVGALAYIIYKKHKVEFYKSHANAGPTQAEIDSFHAIALLQTSIDLYRSQAEALASNFLTVALDEIVERTESETRQDILYSHIGTLNTGLQTQLTSATTALQAQLNTVNAALGAKRTVLGWLRDVGGNLVVNIVTIFVIGAVVIGYSFLSELQQRTERKAGVNTQAAPAAAATPQTAGQVATDSRPPHR